MRRLRKVLVGLGVVAVGALGLSFWGSGEEPAPQETALVEQAAEAPAVEESAPPRRDFSSFESGLGGILGSTADRYSVYLWYAGDDEPYIYNDATRRSASMIKVFIMAHAMDEARAGRLDLAATLTLKSSDKVGGAGVLAGYPTGTALTIERLIYLMITESDNIATNMLIDYLGMDAINSYIAASGYSHTALRRHMMDLDAARAGRENETTASDLGLFFRRLYSHECVAGYDAQMIAVLLDQTDTEVFPAALPGARIAHKTGELDGLYDDGGIVYSAGGDCVLVVLDDDIGRGSAVRRMRQIAQLALESQ